MCGVHLHSGTNGFSMHFLQNLCPVVSSGGGGVQTYVFSFESSFASFAFVGAMFDFG